MPHIGIDLGTTNSCVAAWDKNGKVDILKNDCGEAITPSCVTFTDYGRDIGKAATLQRKKYPENTIYAVKRIIGRKFSEDSVKEDVSNWQFKVVNQSGEPKVKVQTKAGTEYFTPEQISAEILKAMKKIAEERTTGTIYNAVVTVPAYFNDAQRNATLDAAKVAKLYVPKIINEPTAAAIAYAHQKKISSRRTVLVYDLGGGTFDVTLVTIEDMDCRVLATGGDTHLGGDDFNKNMMDHLLEAFEKKNGKGIRGNGRAMVRLYEECEKNKG